MEKRTKERIATALPILLLLFITLNLACSFGIQDNSSVHINKLEVEDQQHKMSPFARLVRGKDRKELESTGLGCDISENSIVCVSDKPVKIDSRKNNITIYDSSKRKESIIDTVKPYALQKDEYLLQFISPAKLLHGANNAPPCKYKHDIPAVIFSTGVSGNIFHEFNDIIIPLYITVRHFKSRVLIIIEDYSPAFVQKFHKIISRLSSYEVMNPAVNRSVHCFPGLVIGLKYHNNLALNYSDIPGGYTMTDFRHFLSQTYNLKFRHVSEIKRPTLVLLSREKKRRLMNEREVIAMMKGLGFRVIVAKTKDAWDLEKFGNIVNSCSVLVGVHGAGLTNELFLPVGAVVVQVEPLGLEWAAENYYGYPPRAMGVQYLRYKIEPEESSLMEMYGHDNPIVADPDSVFARGFRVGKALYLDKQNVRVDVVRFRETLVKTLHMVQKPQLI